MKASKLFLTAILTSTMTLAAFAGPTVTVNNSPYQADQGGEFNVSIIGTGTGLAVGSQFASFCLEKNEYLSLGSSYYGHATTAARNGGIGGQLPGTQTDPLDSRTAWLYNQFLNGSLTGYNFSTTTGRQSSAEALQHAFWYIEQEETAANLNALACSTRDAAWAFIQQAGQSSWASQGTIGDVRVLNLYSDAAGCQPAQDVLCRLTPAAVPAPGALLLAGLGTSILGFIRRKRTLG